MVEFTEIIQKVFLQGGKPALLADLYLDNSETLRVTNWDEALYYTDPISGSSRYYSPAPFYISEDQIIKGVGAETSVLQVFFGIVRHSGESETDNFTQSEINQFTEALSDIDEYLSKNDIRGSLCILRIINVDDLNEDWKIFTGIVDQYLVEDEGISFEIAEPNDILDAPIYPISTMCPYKFGDSRCSVDADSAANLYQGTCESGSSTSQIVDSSVTNNTDNYWKPGVVIATSGENKGLAREVKSNDSGTTTITFTIPFTNAFAVGDTFDLRRRCGKTAEFCAGIFSNLESFGGYRDVNQPIQGLFFRGR